MTRFASTLLQVTDTRRVTEVREFQAAQVARDFAPVRARIAANVEAAKVANARHSLY